VLAEAAGAARQPSLGRLGEIPLSLQPRLRLNA